MLKFYLRKSLFTRSIIYHVFKKWWFFGRFWWPIHHSRESSYDPGGLKHCLCFYWTHNWCPETVNICEIWSFYSSSMVWILHISTRKIWYQMFNNFLTESRTVKPSRLNKNIFGVKKDQFTAPQNMLLIKSWTRCRTPKKPKYHHFDCSCRLERLITNENTLTTDY